MTYKHPESKSGFRWGQFSFRTGFWVMTGIALIMFSTSVGSAVTAHTILVLAFAIPGGSYGYDVGGTSRSMAIGTVAAAIGGSLLLSVVVLAIDFARL